MPNLQDLQEFPSIYTFKLVMDFNEDSINQLLKIFDLPDREVNISKRDSKTGKYVSYSITTIIEDNDELNNFYEKISKIKGIKFNL